MKQISLQNVKRIGRLAAADHGVEHVFNIDETVLLWKKMPTGTFVSKN